MLTLSNADGDDRETWEDLLEMEESVWDPHSGQGMGRTSFLLVICYKTKSEPFLKTEKLRWNACCHAAGLISEVFEQPDQESGLKSAAQVCWSTIIDTCSQIALWNHLLSRTSL